MFERIGFVIGEALSGLRRNLLMTFSAVTTVAISLYLLGGLGYLYFRIESYSRTIPGMFDIRVYLKDQATPQDVATTAAKVRAMPGVRSVVWLPKDKMWERTKVENPGVADVPNPYPDGLKIVLDDLDKGTDVVGKIRQIPIVSDEPHAIVYRSDEQRFINEVLSIVKWVGTTAGGLLFLTAGLLIYNAIRLTILSRRVEIRIMRLVGASGLTVAVPFLLEGIVQGAVGGLIAALLLDGSSVLVTQFIASLFSLAKPPVFPLGWITGLLSGAGAAYGLLCSSMAIVRPVRTR